MKAKISIVSVGQKAEWRFTVQSEAKPVLTWYLYRDGSQIKSGKFTNNEQYYRFVDQIRQAGIMVPVIPGLKPISSQRQIDLLPRSFHIDIPQPLVSRLSYAKTANDAYKVGIEWAIEQSRDLLAHGAPAIHYYTMAKTDNVCQIVKSVF